MGVAVLSLSLSLSHTHTISLSLSLSLSQTHTRAPPPREGVNTIQGRDLGREVGRDKRLHVPQLMSSR